MRVGLNVPGPVTEPRIWVEHGHVLAMALRPGSIETGLGRSAMRRVDYDAGEMGLIPRHVEKWFRIDDLHYLSIVISDATLTAACDGTSGEVELRQEYNLVDPRVGALIAAVDAERLAGFQSGLLFLDSVEQALAAVLVDRYAVRHSSVRTYRGGLGPARLRTIKELVDARMEDELSLCEMAQSVGLSNAHFWRMFRESTGETPHQFVLRQRVERAKAMLRAADARVMDVAVACGFKTQQHFARVFRHVCGASPTEYRQEFLRHGATCAWETCSHAMPSVAPTVSAAKL
jgi:AraC family transcriptional regulator